MFRDQVRPGQRFRYIFSDVEFVSIIHEATRSLYDYDPRDHSFRTAQHTKSVALVGRDNGREQNLPPHKVVTSPEELEVGDEWSVHHPREWRLDPDPEFPLRIDDGSGKPKFLFKGEVHEFGRYQQGRPLYVKIEDRRAS